MALIISREVLHLLEKEMATHSSILAWRILGMEEPGGLPSVGSHACIGGGNGNPLQYSCLENPRDRGAWWAAVYGVAQSRIRLSSSSSSLLLLFTSPLLVMVIADPYDITAEKAMAPHSSTLAWQIPWTEELGRLQSMGSLRVGHD